MTTKTNIIKKAIIGSLLIWTSQSFAFKYAITCEGGRLIKFASSANDSNYECEQFKKLGFENCFDTKKKESNKDIIALSIPFDSYYSSRESASYSRVKIEQIIEFAIKYDIDPYLTLAFRIMEYPPTQEKAKFDAYDKIWGIVPIDAPAFADFLGCKVESLVERKGLGGKFSIFSESKLKDVIAVNENALVEKVCLEDTAIGGSPNLSWGCKPEIKCCFNAKVKLINQYNSCKSVAPNDRALLIEKAAASYIKQRIGSSLRHYQSILNDPALLLAFSTQSFNGYGKFGVTEKMSNNCLNYMNFSKTPLYGAGVADIMVNSLMANESVREIVNRILKKYGKKNSKSLVCNVLGNEGNYFLQADVFVKLQQQFLDGKKNCPIKTYQLKLPK